jgi:dTDP-4-dehydrorhamnose 3,5-epimerase
VKFTPLKAAGAWVIELEPRVDDRGFFQRTYDTTSFAERGLSTAWVQDNEAYNSRRGIVRGLHFQAPPHAETKLVRVVEGAIWDVLVDIRLESQTYGQWEAVELSADNRPRGFAHGYCTLTDTARVLYKVDASYAPSAEGGLRFDDPRLNIAWPVRDPLLSPKDLQWPTLDTFDSPFKEMP